MFSESDLELGLRVLLDDGGRSVCTPILHDIGDGFEAAHYSVLLRESYIPSDPSKDEIALQQETESLYEELKAELDEAIRHWEYRQLIKLIDLVFASANRVQLDDLTLEFITSIHRRWDANEYAKRVAVLART